MNRHELNFLQPGCSRFKYIALHLYRCLKVVQGHKFTIDNYRRSSNKMEICVCMCVCVCIDMEDGKSDEYEDYSF